MTVDVVIPALNEQASVGLVLQALPHPIIRTVYVCDNGSTDRTAEMAASHGARVVSEMRRGYGSACLKALDAIARSKSPPDVVAFLDADFSDDPAELVTLLDHLEQNQLDLVIGSRVLGNADPGSLTPVQRFGNALSTLLIRWLFNYRFTDLGPFRVIRYDRLLQLNMSDPDFGWTVEMQVKAAKHQLRVGELPVRYRKRLGTSKVSGTLRGALGAGLKILYTIFKSYVKG
ncbi:MAG: glycosyltransferase family 2 protein [Saprospiraceae bacterium]|nr:glycosyltransferase family 2 protein [Saprospiraceae bacterium]